ncbi:MAG: carbon-nitrogen hydrolase family protein [Methanomassiliicoccales archaeon]|jgi:predicted amidohydrolase|nr:carbon-nitrogen hydrolase family protein [Methanomassiliicoccales archaeon]
MKIVLAQVASHVADKSKNIQTIERVVKKVDADLVVFSETFLTGYMCRDLFFKVAEGIEGESVRRIKKIAEEHCCGILFGMPLLDENLTSLVKNSAVLVSPDGYVQRYDKLSLANFGPFEEKLYFCPGDAPKLFELNRVKIGPIICYDIFFPEISKYYATLGAEVIICIAASPYTSKPYFERVIPARAIENTVYVIYVNQVGTQLNQVFFGGSQVANPRGDIIVRNKYYDEDITTVEVDPAEIRLARQMRPTLRNTFELSNILYSSSRE